MAFVHSIDDDAGIVHHLPLILVWSYDGTGGMVPLLSLELDDKSYRVWL